VLALAYEVHKGRATKEATYFETYGLSHWKLPSLLPGRSVVWRLASPAVNGSLPLASLKRALSDEGFFLWELLAFR